MFHHKILCGGGLSFHAPHSVLRRGMELYGAVAHGECRFDFHELAGVQDVLFQRYARLGDAGILQGDVGHVMGAEIRCSVTMG